MARHRHGLDPIPSAPLRRRTLSSGASWAPSSNDSRLATPPPGTLPHGGPSSYRRNTSSHWETTRPVLTTAGTTGRSPMGTFGGGPDSYITATTAPGFDGIASGTSFT